MDRAILDKIIFYFNNMVTTKTYVEDDINLLNKVYLVLGKEKAREEGVNNNTYKYFINNVTEITLRILEVLDPEDKEYFLEQLPRFIKISLLDDKEKQEILDTLNPAEKTVVIQSFKYTDYEKIALLSETEDEFQRIQIIESLQDDDKKIELLETIKNKRDKAKVIATLNDDNKKIELLKDIESEINRANIIKGLQNDDIKIKLLEDIKSETNRIRVIESIKDDNKKQKFLKELTHEEIRATIIVSMQEDNKKIELLENIKNEKNRVDIIKSLHDDEKKIELLKNITNEIYRTDIIVTIDDDSKKVRFLDTIKNVQDKTRVFKSLQTDDKKIEALDYINDLDVKLFLIREIRDVKKRDYAARKIDKKLDGVFRKIDELEKEKLDNYNKYKKINLPENMTFGIEIEATGKYRELLPVHLGEWKKVSDDSTGSNGQEIVSPIMHDSLEYTNQIYKVNDILQNIGMEATQKCGGHVHIGADYIKTEEGFRQLIELWGNAEEIYYLISNRPGELPRDGIERYAAPVSKKFEEANLGNTNCFIQDAKRIFENDKYRSLNLKNVNGVKNTIEFRVSNGTINGDTWIENIRLYGRTIEMAQALGQIVDKLETARELTEEEKRKLELKERLKVDISLDEKMDILMQMLFNEEEREVYYERYKTNKELDRKDHIVSGLKFEKVDFRKVYEGVEIPEGIVNDIQNEAPEIIEQR